MEGLITQQVELYHRLSRVYDNLKKKGAAKMTEGAVQARLDLLISLWEQFSTQHVELAKKRTEEWVRHDYFVKDCFDLAEESFLEQKGYLLDILRGINRKSAPVTMASTSAGAPVEERRSRATLPRIPLPSFDGRYSEWQSFHDSFVSLVIKDPYLMDVDRLHYLKGCVTGDASTVIRNHTTTDGNFQPAWDALKDRFQNKRLLVNAQLNILNDLPTVKSESSSELKRLFYGTWDVVGALAAMNRPVTTTDWLVKMTVDRLDEQSRREWEASLGLCTEPPSLDTLRVFIETRIHTVEALENQRKRDSPVEYKQSTPKDTAAKGASAKGSTAKGASVHQVVATPSPSKDCGLCKGFHYLLFCSKFKVQDATAKKATVEKLQRCLNCLGKHQIDSCQSIKRCQKCAEQHHTCLHDAFQTIPGAVEQHVTPRVLNTPPVMLGLARVRVYTPVGQHVSVRALIDPGSEVSLISEQLVQRLGLKRQRARIPLLFAGGAPSQCTRGSVHLDITADREGESILALVAFVLTDLSSYKPPVVPDGTVWPHLQGLQWAEPRLSNQDPIELLLGADSYNDFMLEGVRKGKPGTPLAQETTFGWILTGGLRNGRALSRKSASTVQCCSISQELPGLLEKFWEQEEVQAPPTLSRCDQEAEDHFQATYRRTTEGRFVVRLPFKVTPELGLSRPTALRTLNSMQQRFIKNYEYKQAYQDFLQEYENLGHMVAARAPPEGRHFYLPHHGVLKSTSSTTKLRVVFNGSMSTSNGKSLTDVLHTGPNLLPNLADLLLKWRRHPIAFVADVEKMYRQIVIHPDDRDYQRILWRKGKESRVKEYKLCTVTYGLGCAPYLALRCLRQLATDEAESLPLASRTMLSDVYMDDILTGAATVEEALTLQKELDQLAMAGGFRLHKWASNSPELMRSIHNDVADLTRHWDTDTQHSVLGIQWFPDTDNFQIRLLDGSSSPATTKRSVLSQAAQIFDPLGWLAPVTCIQSLWALPTDWDEPLPVQSEGAWLEFLKALPALRQIQNPRCLGMTSTTQTVEVHGFSDASERAYAAVVYLRVQDASGAMQIHLISAKTKVAPLKQLSLPRLELSGAHLLTRLVAHLLPTLDLRIDGVHFWTDALVALGWIQAPSSRWQTYVANRVADIQRTLPQAHWRHVPGPENPADCASRGLTPHDLPEHSLWWSGPPWLSTSEGRPVALEEPIEMPHDERRRILHIQRPSDDKVSLHLNLFSNFRRLLRVTAWCCRWLPSARGRRLSYLVASEIRDAQTRLVRIVQATSFTSELDALQKHQPLPRRSRLLRLNPFKDPADGTLRVGGRLHYSRIDYNQRHPVILPDDSPLASLWITEAHRRCLHGGVQLTLSTLRQHCWVLRGRQLVKACIHRCLTCVRWKGNTTDQLMGVLPTPRVTPCRPFLRVGVDYAGPIFIRSSRGRGQQPRKGYISLFICLATKAVHLEVVSDGTTEAFLAALKRLTSRRGLCSQIYSDCGTAFVGADKELRVLLQAVSPQNRQLLDHLASEGIEWKFNPPSAPHFGGIWEAAVKSVKHHLRRVLGEHKLTYEELATLLAEIEACLNSRPLIPLSDDPDDLDALTPGHFLIGEAITAIPEPNLGELPDNRLSRWQLVQKMQQHFWRLWSRDYLNTLQTRGKWNRARIAIREGDLCLIKSEVQPPSRWPLARVLKTHPGPDGLTRVLTLKTATSEFTRPLNKLILLPFAATTEVDAGSSQSDVVG